jgi:hypothetical protein
MPIATPLRCLGLAALFTLSVLGRAQSTIASNVAGPGPGEVIVLDTASGVTCTFTSSTPRTHIGLPIAVADPGAPLAITGMEAHFVSTTGQAWEDVRIRVQFWEYMNPGLDPLFSGRRTGAGHLDWRPPIHYPDDLQRNHPIRPAGHV